MYYNNNISYYYNYRGLECFFDIQYKKIYLNYVITTCIRVICFILTNYHPFVALRPLLFSKSILILYPW